MTDEAWDLPSDDQPSDDVWNLNQQPTEPAPVIGT